jgi:hypothetical protein
MSTFFEAAIRQVRPPHISQTLVGIRDDGSARLIVDAAE